MCSRMWLRTPRRKPSCICALSAGCCQHDLLPTRRPARSPPARASFLGRPAHGGSCPAASAFAKQGKPPVKRHLLVSCWGRAALAVARRPAPFLDLLLPAVAGRLRRHVLLIGATAIRVVSRFPSPAPGKRDASTAVLRFGTAFQHCLARSRSSAFPSLSPLRRRYLMGKSGTASMTRRSRAPTPNWVSCVPDRRGGSMADRVR